MFTFKWFNTIWIMLTNKSWIIHNEIILMIQITFQNKVHHEFFLHKKSCWIFIRLLTIFSEIKNASKIFFTVLQAFWLQFLLLKNNVITGFTRDNFGQLQILPKIVRPSCVSNPSLSNQILRQYIFLYKNPASVE